MKKIAVYGKGGIGKSTTVSNLAVALAEKGYKVMQIGCDPKADSTIQLRHGKEIPTVLEMFQQKKQNLKLEDMVTVGYAGVVCVEAGRHRHRDLDVQDAGLSPPLRSWKKPVLMRPTSRISCYTMYLVM